MQAQKYIPIILELLAGCGLCFLVTMYHKKYTNSLYQSSQTFLFHEQTMQYGLLCCGILGIASLRVSYIWFTLFVDVACGIYILGCFGNWCMIYMSTKEPLGTNNEQTVYITSPMVIPRNFSIALLLLIGAMSYFLGFLLSMMIFLLYTYIYKHERLLTFLQTCKDIKEKVSIYVSKHIPLYTIQQKNISIVIFMSIYIYMLWNGTIMDYVYTVLIVLCLLFCLFFSHKQYD